jgi:hypothetical protein
MTKHFHIIYVHPVENGKINLHKVRSEREFVTEQEARDWVANFNYDGQDDGRWARDIMAVYYGCVNDETGELV